MSHPADYGYSCRICGNTETHTLVKGIKDWEYGYSGHYCYKRCLGCGSIQIHPFPALEDLMDAYKVDYHGFAEPARKGIVYKLLYRLSEKSTMGELKKIIGAGSKILDVGCGIGLFLSRLKSMGINDIEGIDFSEFAVEHVKSRGIGCFRGTFMEFDGKAGSYDMISMNNYLEHTLNPLDELKKARKLLKDGALLYGELPNFTAFDNVLFGKYWGGNHVPRHTFQFSPGNLRKLLDMAGFARVEIKYPLNTSHFALSVQNYMQRNRADLKNNDGLIHGRAWYYYPTMIGLVPAHVLLKIAGKTGFMKFYAR